jgi:hypothetical protein
MILEIIFPFREVIPIVEYKFGPDPVKIVTFPPELLNAGQAGDNVLKLFIVAVDNTQESVAI